MILSKKIIEFETVIIVIGIVIATCFSHSLNSINQNDQDTRLFVTYKIIRYKSQMRTKGNGFEMTYVFNDDVSVQWYLTMACLISIHVRVSCLCVMYISFCKRLGQIE